MPLSRPRPAPLPPPHVLPCEAPPVDLRTLEHATPAQLGIEQRIAMATRCRDADMVPKVPGAGTVSVGADGRPVQLMHNGIRCWRVATTATG